MLPKGTESAKLYLRKDGIPDHYVSTKIFDWKLCDVLGLSPKCTSYRSIPFPLCGCQVIRLMLFVNVQAMFLLLYVPKKCNLHGSVVSVVVVPKTRSPKVRIFSHICPTNKHSFSKALSSCDNSTLLVPKTLSLRGTAHTLPDHEPPSCRYLRALSLPTHR